ncbi:hypothetical protein JTB14_008311 [Gonioctena quinquepunctata]|nr:hypothetical protein JTB14_008311 [Gonioctena quinquepunctata]
MSKTLIIAVCLLVAFQFATGTSLKGDFQWQINEGDCRNALPEDRVFDDLIEHHAFPFIKGSKTSQWSGSGKIYCVVAISLLEESEGSTAAITSGGVGESSITIEMHSASGKGFQYTINIFAK